MDADKPGMPRIARVQRVGVVHHVISRFVDHSWKLAADDERSEYLSRLELALNRSDWCLLAYALMSSHVHLVLEAGEIPLGSWAKSVHSGIARWLNMRCGRLGPVFAARPYAEAVEPAAVPFLIAYVHNNPVRAKLVDWAGDSTWTSHSAYLGACVAPACLAVARGLDLSGYAANIAGRKAFDGWVRSRSGAASMSGEQQFLATLRDVRQTLGPHAVLGAPTATLDGRCFPVLASCGSVMRPIVKHVSPVALLEAVESLCGTDPRGLRGRDRRPCVTRARRVALLAWSRTGRPRVEMARALGISESSASDLLHRAPQGLPYELAQRIVSRVMAP